MKTRVLEISEHQSLWIPEKLPSAKELSIATSSNVERHRGKIDLLVNYLRRRGHGVIALPQIGVNITGLVASKTWNTGKVEVGVLLNPDYEPLEGSSVVYCSEQCMNLGPIPVGIPRHSKCKVTYRQLNWMKATQVLVGDIALSMQHAIDHATGRYWGIENTNVRAVS